MTEHFRGDKKAYRPDLVAELLDISRSKVYEEMDAGRLRSIKIGRCRRITDEHIAEYLHSLEQVE